MGAIKMKISKRIAATGLAAIMAVAVCGCGKSAETAGTSGSGGGTTAAVAETKEGAEGSAKLRFSWWGGEERHGATLAVLEQYQSENPGIVIEGEYSGWDGYLEKMTTQLAAGTAPDIIQIDYAFLEALWRTDDFVDFNKQDTVDMSGFSESLLTGITSPDGRLIGLPCGINFTGLFGNKAAAEKYGVDLTQHFTWDRLLEEGKRVHEQDENAYLMYPYNVTRYFFEPYLFNMTGKKLVEDDYTLGFTKEDLVKTYSYIDQLYKEGVMQPYDETIEIQVPAESPLWLNDQIVLCPEFGAGYDSFKASLPEGNLACLEALGDSEAENTGIVLRPTNMLAVNAKSENLEEALKFVEYFYNNETAIELLGMCRAIPATEKGLDMMVKSGKLDADLKKIADFAQDHKGGMGQNIISTNAEIESIEGDMLSALYYGDVSPEEAAEEFMRLMTDKVEELKGNLEQ